MNHLKNIQDIEQTLSDNRLCLFYIKAPDCGVCNVMLDRIREGYSICHIFKNNRRIKNNFMYTNEVFIDVDDSTIPMEELVKECELHFEWRMIPRRR